jgi:hypothetical protein
MFWPCPSCKYRNFAHLEACSQCGSNRPFVQAEPNLGQKFVRHNSKPPETKPQADEPGHYRYF